jgi:hypothetical protein
MVKYETVFENGINARLLAKLTQQAIIMFRRNVDQYFHESNSIHESLSNTRAVISRHEGVGFSPF